MPIPPRLEVDDVLGGAGASTPKYRIVRHLGSGGVGQVYLARIIATRELVVLKVPRTWESVHDLVQEIRYLGRESLPHIARMRDIDTALLPAIGLELPFLVMDAYLCNLYQHVATVRTVDVPTAIRWIGQMARGLHNSQLVHRDLKPENILLDAADNVWVSDFGLAVPANPYVRKKIGLLLEGALGTAIYMSPEQIFEAEDLDVRSDIFALGLILYEMLVGRTARPAAEPDQDDQAYLASLLDHEVPWADVPHPEVARIVRHCTANARRERYPDYWSLLTDLDECR